MTDDPTGAAPTTAAAPAAPTQGGEPTGDRGVFEDLPDHLADSEAQPQEPESAQPQTQPGTQAAPPELHESLKPLANLRLTDPEAVKAWNEHLAGLDKKVRQHEASVADFQSEHGDTLALGNSLAEADTPEKAVAALKEGIAMLERAHGYKVDLGQFAGQPAAAAAPQQPQAAQVPKAYDDPRDQEFFEKSVGTAVEIATSRLAQQNAALEARIADLEPRLGLVDQIAQERKAAAERQKAVERIQREAPEAIERTANEASGWKATPEQAMEAGLKYPHLPLDGAIFLTFKKDIYAHVGQVAQRGNPRQGTMPAATGAQARPPVDLTRFDAEEQLRRVVAEQS